MLAVGAFGLIHTASGSALAGQYTYTYGPTVIAPLPDFTHDGRADFAEQNVIGPFYVHQNLWGSTGFDSANYDQGSTICSSSIKAHCDVMVADFTGDGFADYADHDKATGNFYIHANRTYGFGFDSANWGTGQTGTGQVLVADFTGDGYADFADFDITDAYDGTLSIHENLAAQNSPNRFGSRSDVWYSTPVKGYDILVGEFTGDAFADYAVRTPTNPGVYEIHQNLGMKFVRGPWFGVIPAGFSDAIWNTFPACVPTQSGDCRTIIGDFDGDKMADKADWDLVTGIFNVHLNRGANSYHGLGFASEIYESGKSCVPTVSTTDHSYGPYQDWCGIFGQPGSVVVNQ
jgi:hypothetical protein